MNSVHSKEINLLQLDLSIIPAVRQMKNEHRPSYCISEWKM